MSEIWFCLKLKKQSILSCGSVIKVHASKPMLGTFFFFKIKFSLIRLDSFYRNYLNCTLQVFSLFPSATHANDFNCRYKWFFLDVFNAILVDSFILLGTSYELPNFFQKENSTVTLENNYWKWEQTTCTAYIINRPRIDQG